MSLGVSCEASEMCSFHLGGQEELFVQSLQNSEDRGRANVDLLTRLIISTALDFLLKVFFKGFYTDTEIF